MVEHGRADMNWYWTIAGGLAIVGGLAHLLLGESRIISRLDPSTLHPSPPMSGDTAKRYLRWFWQVGTVNIFGAATVGELQLLRKRDAPPPKALLKQFRGRIGPNLRL